MKATLYREINDTEVAIRVTFALHGTHRPATRTDPAEEPELEIESATRLDTGAEVDLTDDEQAECWSLANDARLSAIEEREIERWMDREEMRRGAL